MKHTPGPWNRIIADGYTVRHPQVYSDAGPVANATWLGDGRIDELNANARLIASAPELLEALKDIAQCMASREFGECCGYSERLLPVKDALGNALAAIKKAGGES